MVVFSLGVGCRVQAPPKSLLYSGLYAAESSFTDDHLWLCIVLYYYWWLSLLLITLLLACSPATVPKLVVVCMMGCKGGLHVMGVIVLILRNRERPFFDAWKWSRAPASIGGKLLKVFETRWQEIKYNNSIFYHDDLYLWNRKVRVDMSRRHHHRHHHRLALKEEEWQELWKK
jgi:hypothetical protein